MSYITLANILSFISGVLLTIITLIIVVVNKKRDK